MKDDISSLAHTKWECKYHIVFAVKFSVKDNNEYRPSYALNYKNPIEYKIQLGFR